MPTTQTIPIDLNTRGANPVAFTHQGDTARAFAFEVYNNGVEFDLTGYTAQIGAILPADRGYTVIAGNDMATGSISENTITATLPAAYTAKAGHGILTIILTGSGGTLRPINIDLRIQKSADSDEVIAGASDFPEGLEDIAESVFQGYLSTYLPPVAPSSSADANKAASAKLTGQELDDLKSDIEDLQEAVGIAKYGVTGIGQSASALTRLWDAVGMTAQVGTDGDNTNVVNDFDNAAPFNRRKCVGTWRLVDGKAVFRVNAYLGDDDYTEDGSMGDYVAVECPKCFYYFDGSTLGVSAYRHPGWRPFDIFCRNHDESDLMDFYYMPAYALALDANGHGVSLPGLDNVQGAYKTIMDAARSYDNEAAALAIAQPVAVNFYEWALFTVEFATQNCQSIMDGCASLRHDNNDRVTFLDSTHLLTSNYYASRVAGQYISVLATSVDINSANYLSTHKVLSVTRCDENGVASSSGSHQLLEVEDLGKGYYTYDTTTEYRIEARPYRTGSCNGVSTPSGSPVSNSDGYHPMKYRHRENVYGNQFKTSCDLFNKLVQDENSENMLEWYYLKDPKNYTPSTTSKPDATDLATSAFVKLDVETPHVNYASGYIKSKKYSKEYPNVWIPDAVTGGSATTYFCDYAALSNSHAVRACRFGGAWNAGAYAGFSYLYGYNAPANALAIYGGDLFVSQ